MIFQICIRFFFWFINFFDSCVRAQETKKKTYEQSHGSSLVSWDSYFWSHLLFLALVFPLYQSIFLRWVWRSSFLSVDQPSAEALFRWEIWIQESNPFHFTVHELVRRTWWAPFHLGWRDSFKWCFFLYTYNLLVVSHGTSDLYLRIAYCNKLYKLV